MKTFIFYQKNSSLVVILSAPNFEEAEKELAEHVFDIYGWRCDNADGEEY